MKKLLILLTPLLLGAAPATPLDRLTSTLGELKPWYEDRHELGRTDRLRVLARAQLSTVQKYTSGPRPQFKGSPKDLLALLVTIGFWESRYAKHIHAGNCGEDECDGGWARGVYQVQLGNGVVSDELWNRAAGLDYESTLAATELAAETLSANWGCHRRHGIEGVLSAYARGNCTQYFPGKYNRYRWFKDIRKGLSP